MDSSGDKPDANLPPPPPRPAGVVPRTLADVAGGNASGSGGAGEGPEPPGKKLKPTAVLRFPQMKRPGFGTKGQKVELLCNHFKVTFKPSEPVYHYHVSIVLPSTPLPHLFQLNMLLDCSLAWWSLRVYSAWSNAFAVSYLKK